MAKKGELKLAQESKLLDDLNNEQKAAVTHREGPLLIVAGAGTGKTTVITRRIAYLIEQGAKPEEILAMAFGEKAAAEMEERVGQLLPIGYYNLQISTFHSFCEQILREHGIEIGLPDFKILNEVGQWILIRNNLDKFDLNYYRPLGNPTKFIKALINHFSRAKDELIAPEEYLEYTEKLRLSLDAEPAMPPPSPPRERGSKEGVLEAEEIIRIQEVANAYHVYQKLLLDNNSLDFGDLINYSLKLFKDRPRVLEIYRQRFKHIMVDEFQDTNFAQYELVRLLASPGNNLVVVGDDDQSIFKFRGASISNILHFQRDYKDAKFINLARNYRSRQNILDAAYEFIKLNDPDRLEVKLGISKKLAAVPRASSGKEKKGTIEQIAARDYIEEAELVVEKILILKKDNPELTWNDFAILARSHDSLEPFIGKLEHYNLPYIYFANKGLYRKSVILDLLAYFKLLDNYHESAAMYRALNFPIFGIDRKAIIEISHFAKKKNLSLHESAKQAATLSIGQKSLLGINKLLTLLERHQSLAASKTAARVFVETIRDLDFRKIISQDAAQGLQNGKFLETFFRRVQDFQNESGDKSLKAFLEELRFEQEAGELGNMDFDPEAGPEAIKLMTVHAAKGLEYAHVFAVGLVDKRFPTIERREPIEIPEPLIKDILPVGDIHLKEERRLFYVAMTRAKEGLFLTRALDYGGKRRKKPSRFLVELGLAKEEKGKSTGDVKFSASPSVPLPGAEREGTVLLPLPKYFSFSQISTFRACPLEYKYRYIFRLPEPGTGRLSFGVTIHAVLERFLKYYRQNIGHQDLFGDVKTEPGLPSFEYLLKLYGELWIDDWYDNKKQMEDYRKLGRKILENFYEYTKAHMPRPKYIEHGFRMKLDDSWLNCKIDRADETANGLIIIDYKTGEPKTKLSPVDKEQLLLYQWAVQDFLKEKVAGLQYWYLKDKLGKEAFLGTPLELRDVQRKLLETIKEIKQAVAADDFRERDRRISGHTDCDYRQLES